MGTASERNSFGRLALLAALLVGISPAAEAALQPAFVQRHLEDVDGRTRAWGLAIADFTADGIADIIAGDTFGDVHLFVGGGDGTFADLGVVVNMSYHDAYALLAADFDGDGRQDFALAGTSATAEGHVLIYLGNGDGTFQSSGFPQRGVMAGDGGTDTMVLAAADVDGDGDVDLVVGDVTASENARADVTLLRNQLDAPGGLLAWTSETLIAGVDRGSSPVPEEPPYYPPIAYLQAYGLAFGDVDSDGDPDLLVADRANYLYVYENGGDGSFAPIRYDRVSGRPYACDRLYENFTYQMPLAAGDLNSDGWVDFATATQTGGAGSYPGQVEVWVNEGPDASGRPAFSGGGVVGDAGTDARGLAIGQLDPWIDLALDVAFGNYQGDVHGLFADLTDSDGDGIVDLYDNAPSHANPPVVDMNTDGAVNRLDQLDNDHDGVGDPADPDDDADGIPDDIDNCRWGANAAQLDADLDGAGDACDPLDGRDTDGDGIPDGPASPELAALALDAKARWARSDTHFVIRIDALGRVFQNEFTQIMTDAAILTPEQWEAKKLESYNGVGDDPALPGYQVPADLAGGMDVPITLAVIPKQIFHAFGDSDPIRWINDRNGSPNLEIIQHGTYHANNTPLGSWATDPTRNFFSCEACGLPTDVAHQLLRVGRRTLLGDYGADPWIQQSGADPLSSPRIDWSDAAKPLISYSPPFNTSDPESRDAVCRFPAAAFSASIWEEESPIFTPEGSHHEALDAFGMYHASADRQVDPVAPDGMTFDGYLDSITEEGGLNTWLIEEVEWSTRHCNDQSRLTACPGAPGGINRENNMVDPARWERWLALLDFVKARGEVMTMGDYALAVTTDNCPGNPNPLQEDRDADGRGNPCDLEWIDIKPGPGANAVNPDVGGVIAVAIMGTEWLDPADVVVETLGFGPEGARPDRAPRFEDVNADGYLDLLTHYRVGDTGISRGDTEACLAGWIGLTAFEACDSIVTPPVREN